jgi:hypothetical protein
VDSESDVERQNPQGASMGAAKKQGKKLGQDKDQGARKKKKTPS